MGLERDTVLFQRSQKATFGVVVLNGAVQVLSGEEDFGSTFGPWSCLGMRALEPPVRTARLPSTGPASDELMELHDAHDYIPDFSATVLTGSCVVLKIERQAYLKAYLRTS